MKTPALETSRLYLRPLQAEDALQIQKIFPQWEIVRHLAAGFPGLSLTMEPVVMSTCSRYLHQPKD